MNSHPVSLAEAHAHAQRNPLPDTLPAMAALAQCVLGRSTANSAELRAGLFLAIRRAVRQSRMEAESV